MENKVTYSKTFAAIILIGAACSFFSFFMGFSMNIIIGILFLIMGIRFLNGAPVIIYDKKEMQIKNIFGTTMKTYSFKKDKLSVKEGVIYSNDNKVRIGAAFLNKSELGQLHDTISKN